MYNKELSAMFARKQILDKTKRKLIKKNIKWKKKILKIRNDKDNI